jgi:hypothetical protein
VTGGVRLLLDRPAVQRVAVALWTRNHCVRVPATLADGGAAWLRVSLLPDGGVLLSLALLGGKTSLSPRSAGRLAGALRTADQDLTALAGV